ncbi:hypothetical protein [Paenibacillus campi]|uniref:hypothetical protein n=1 Tax=Paenibacillus campi TaxID=3106031 RepID=UPI002AFFC78D|nr:MULTISPECIES: hypothetical protein [unclassified Paenibacillus]
MKETVMVKHAVTGREFLNNNRQPFSYQFSELPEGRYRLEFTGIESELAGDIVRFRQELNMFRFEIPEDGAQIKHWYYVSPEHVQFDAEQGRLTIEADSQIRYLPTDYWA